MHIHYFTESGSVKQRGKIKKEKGATKAELRKRGQPTKKGKSIATAQHEHGDESYGSSAEENEVLSEKMTWSPKKATRISKTILVKTYSVVISICEGA